MNKEIADRVFAMGGMSKVSLILTRGEAVEVFSEIGESDLVVVDRQDGRVACVAYHEATDIIGDRMYMIEEKHYKKARRSKRTPINKVLQEFGYVRKNGGFQWQESNQRKAS